MTPLKSCWLNPAGFRDPPVVQTSWWRKFWAPELVAFSLDPFDPLTACLVDGDTVTLIQPRRRFLSDGASTPRILHMLPGYSSSVYKRATYLHDSEYGGGDGQHMVYISRVPRRTAEALSPAALLTIYPPQRETTTRAEADERLRLALPLDGCPEYRARIYWTFVRLCGPRW